MVKYATPEWTAKFHHSLHGTDQPEQLNTAQQPVTLPPGGTDP